MTVADDLLAHLNAELPHKIVIDGVTYLYGFTQIDGYAVFVYEEVVA
jgi:hypothetical protein